MFNGTDYIGIPLLDTSNLTNLIFNHTYHANGILNNTSDTGGIINHTSNITANASGFSSDFNLQKYIVYNLGDKQQSLATISILTVVYITIFLSGIAGNVCTFVVISKNIYMHTVTNYYLASLALSDVLALLFGKY